MKIVIVNGHYEADFIISNFKKNKNNEIICINNNLDVCDYLSLKNDISVFYGDSTKEYILEDANIHDADLFISLDSNDIINYISCLNAKKIFNVKKVISLVVDPNNVFVFKKLGIESAICSTYLLYQMISLESSVETIFRSLSLEDDKIVLTEIELEPFYDIVDKKIMEVGFPPNMSIGCIYRIPEVIIPNGSTRLMANDRLVIISEPHEQEKIIKFIQRKKDEK